MRHILAAFIGLANGVFTGVGAAALLALVKIVPRIAQLIDAPERGIGAASYGLPVGASLASLALALNWQLPLGNFAAALFGLLAGAFVGLLAMSLAEILDVMPVTTGKMQIKNGMAVFIVAILLGKTAGSIIYFLFPIWP